jgi:catechol 2,3-dioxygenase-like lactoylglutathione lyase family enzyme
MPIIKVRDIAFGRLQSPDLDAAEEFLVNFGMVRQERTVSALYMRGTGPSHHLHVTHRGPTAKFIGLAYYAASEEDLARVAKAPGASGVESLNEPGGGKRVRLTEPNGYQIEVVHGIAPVTPIHVPRQRINWRDRLYDRTGEVYRVPRGPSHVKRIGHGVFAAPDVNKTVQWFRDTLGMVCSDDVYVGERDNIVGSFNRCDAGDEFVDHHVLFCARNEKAGLNHLSYEVEDIDDVLLGHEHMKSLGKYRHVWGIGRHLLGSQVFDYWADPWGRVHEHWTDSDRLNVKNGGNVVPAEYGFQSQWGEGVPEAFIQHVSQ